MFVAHRHTKSNLDEGAGDVFFANTESNLDEGAGGSRHDVDYSFHQKRGSISKAHHIAWTWGSNIRSSPSCKKEGKETSTSLSRHEGYVRMKHFMRSTNLRNLRSTFNPASHENYVKEPHRWWSHKAAIEARKCAPRENGKLSRFERFLRNGNRA